MCTPSLSRFSKPLFAAWVIALTLMSLGSLGISGVAFAAGADDEVSVTDAIVTDHHYQFGISSSARAMQGSFDAYGNYQPFAPGSTAVTYTTILTSSYRLSQLFEVGMGLPLRRSSETFPTGTMTSWGLNSPSVNVRAHLGGWPHVTVHVSGSGPWKYSSRTSSGDPGASMPDDLGDGFVSGASLSAGVGVSRTFSPFRVAMDVTGTHPFASTSTPQDAPAGFTVADVTSQSGDRLGFSEGLSYLLSKSWTINAGLRQYWSGPTSVNGLIDGTSRGRSFSTSLGMSYIPNTDWRINASYETQYPFYAYAVNLPYAPAVSLGLMYVGI